MSDDTYATRPGAEPAAASSATHDAGVPGFVVARTEQSYMREIMSLPPGERDVRLLEFVRERLRQAEDRSRSEIDRILNER